MGFMSALRRLFNGDDVSYRWLGDPAFTSGTDYLLAGVDVSRISAEQMWRQQPYLRTVVNFMARNVGQLGLHSFQRVDETDRQRDRVSTLAQLVRRPNAYTTTYELVTGIVGDFALYDTAYLALSKSSTAPSGYELHRMPVPWVTATGGDLFGYGEFKVQAPAAQEPVSISAEDMIVFHGWSPSSLRDGVSPIEALKDILAEQIEASRYRKSVWRRGGKVSSVITRPPGTKWTDKQREAFRSDWNAKFTGSGAQVGGTPILEDGMTLNKVDFSAKEQEYINGAKLGLSTVASVYHINPTMIGLLDNANYSNVREFRKMLYGDSLGPVIGMIEDRLNTFLAPRLDPTGELYLEFNIAEKLQGNFEEQATAFQASVGGPWMSRNEARARVNLPAITGGDELIVPLNVTEGGQASPQDSAPKAADNVRSLTATR